MKKYDTYRVFTPAQPAKLTFIDREIVNEQLVDALRTPGMQIVVYGYSGSGKTTLLTNKINQLYESYIPSQCTKGTTIDQLKLEAFDYLDRYYTTELNENVSNGISASLKSRYAEIKSESKKQEGKTIKRIVPIQLSDQRLAEFVGEAKCCWKIEDFHKVESDDKERLAQLMKVFMDSSMNYPTTKIIAIGAVGTGKEVVAYDKEMSNRLSEIPVPLMSLDELEMIIEKGEFLLNVKFLKEVKNRVIVYSSGLGAVCHQLCLSMCINNGIYETVEETHTFTDSDLDKAIDNYLQKNSSSLKSSYDKATKITKGTVYGIKPILKAILSLTKEKKKDELTPFEIHTEVQKENPTYPLNTVRLYLNQLISAERAEILRYNKDADVYFFSNPFFKAFTELSFSKDFKPSKTDITRISADEIKAYLDAKKDMDEFLSM
ncbi:hypothetical protein SAMN05444411_1233 [Lutibacter oricola]|uniref:AAA ATPase domain-containing protein n=1 Tax=Lutibacter oricola TaxID=762486 RepID=A0A1H3H1K5_9FLAO|nr:ATP-binding protein [Lutibacter oricola]SDY09473.1 hypothetical protein SAMN05444411_1233 [Lutibacter oricola]